MLQVTVVTFALLTQVIIFAHRTTPPQDRCDGLAAIVARMSQRRRVGVTQVVEHHHRRVLGAPERVKLVVVVLARLEEDVPRIHKFALHHWIWIRCRRRCIRHFDRALLKRAALPPLLWFVREAAGAE